MDVANILKPALARGALHCIGATTFGEHQRHIAADAALARRFQPVIVDEPSAREGRAILGGYAAFHEVRARFVALCSIVCLTEGVVLLMAVMRAWRVGRCCGA
jgi:ATP-dependent Clp protease ATP-binding subunit ClpA